MNAIIKSIIICGIGIGLIQASSDVKLSHYDQWRSYELQQVIEKDILSQMYDPSRVTIRSYVQQMGYKKILDIPCALCPDFFGYKCEEPTITYCGVDSIEHVIQLGQARNINCVMGSIEKIPCDSSSIDVCCAWRILEHLSYYIEALHELIRVAKHEVIVIFGVKPVYEGGGLDLKTVSGFKFNQNKYLKGNMESCIATNPKVDQIVWENLNDHEIALHIYLKQFDTKQRVINTLKNNTYQDIDFDVSMSKGTVYYNRCISNAGLYGVCMPTKKASELMDFFRNLYKKNNKLHAMRKHQTRIPKIVHQIWLGSPLPEKYKRWQSSWKRLHPDWEYKLWTDQEVKNITLENKEFYHASSNFGEKANILRYEILYRFGGLYVDMDFECLKPLDILHEQYDLYCGLGPLDGGVLYINNALIGSMPGHPIIKHCIETVKKDKAIETELRKKTMVQNVATGPIHFTKSFLAVAMNNSDNIIALPATFFYPVGNRQHTHEDTIMWALRNAPEALAVHYWAGENLKKTQ